jgi:hypothetical protein
MGEPDPSFFVSPETSAMLRGLGRRKAFGLGWQRDAILPDDGMVTFEKRAVAAEDIHVLDPPSPMMKGVPETVREWPKPVEETGR